MEPTRLRCMLVMRDGPSRRVGLAGVLIGRQPDCDLVTLDPSASRRHALIRIASDGVELVPLGREPVALNGKPTDRAVILANDDEVAVPGLTVTVQIEAAPPERTTAVGFMLVRERGGSFGVSHTPFVIGGEHADLIVKGWPAEAAFRLHVAQGEPFVELCSGAAECNDRALEIGTLEPLAIGDRVTCRDETFVIRLPKGKVATTAVGVAADLPRRIEIELLPRGGRIVFTVAAGDRRVYLADRRLDLMMALLRPPSGHKAGEFIPDDAVRAVVWPRNPGVSRQEINTLISRCRRDLVDAGLAGPRLIERAPGGGGTRIALALDAEVVIKT